MPQIMRKGELDKLTTQALKESISLKKKYSEFYAPVKELFESKKLFIDGIKPSSFYLSLYSNYCINNLGMTEHDSMTDYYKDTAGGHAKFTTYDGMLLGELQKLPSFLLSEEEGKGVELSIIDKKDWNLFKKHSINPTMSCADIKLEKPSFVVNHKGFFCIFQILRKNNTKKLTIVSEMREDLSWFPRYCFEADSKRLATDLFTEVHDPLLVAQKNSLFLPLLKYAIYRNKISR